MLQVEFVDGQVIYGAEIPDSTIPDVYRLKMELVRMSGIDNDDAKLVTLFPFAFPAYTKYLGGAYVSS